MSHGHMLLALGTLLMALAAMERGGVWLLAWPGVSFLLLGSAHFRGAHHLFGKRDNGTLPLWSWLTFLPLISLKLLIWHSIRLVSKEPAFHHVTDTLTVGRRLLTAEVPEGFDNYLDLTAELPEPAAARRLPGYISFPILDASAPPPDALLSLIRSLRPGRTFVHCAQGHGRTGMFALAYLLERGVIRDLDEGLAKLQSIRPGIVLQRTQRNCIQAFQASLAGG